MTNPASLLFTLAEFDHRMCFAYDLNGKRFIYVNPAFESFFRLIAAHASIDTFFDLVHTDDQAYLKQSYANLALGVFKSNIEFRMKLPDKKEYFLRLNLLRQIQEDNETILSGYLEDISAYKAHDDKLNEFANKKNTVLNIISHDLAGPLGSIQNLAALLSRKTKLLDDKEVKKWVLLIEDISKKSVQMIQEFVKLEFIESAGVNLVKKRINLSQIFETAIQEYQQPENERSITFRFNANPAVIYAEIDESKFFQAINNLISNAIKFTPDGGTITLSLEEKEESILITVADTGIGIPKKFHNHLFDKFNSARRTGLKGEPSVGLGMSIIKTIVEWHDGKIWFDSEENKGTSFYIEIAKKS